VCPIPATLDLPQLGQRLSALETDISPALSPFKPIFFSISAAAETAAIAKHLEQSITF